MNATKETLTEDALIGIDRALSRFEDRLSEGRSQSIDRIPEIADLVGPLRAAQSWLMSVQSEIQVHAIASEAS